MSDRYSANQVFPPPTGPLYLLADSQLLFWKRRGKLLLEGVRESLLDTNPSAVYIGASNGDKREFYSIFEAAMEAAGFADRSMINSSFSADDRERLNRAQLIVLAGGDTQLGWNTFEKTGMKEQILARHAQGAVLVGVSAGAVQLGRHAILDKRESSAQELIDVFNLVPVIVDVHDERHEWVRLASTVRMLDGTVTGIGIPSGGGLAFAADGTAEALRHAVHEFSCKGGQIAHSLLLPPEGD
jgi:cyanophycinase